MTKLLAGVALLAMSEDVEIMSQVVEQAVNLAYFGEAPRQPAHSLPGAGPPHDGAKDATGVYLPGYGVLIQLTAPAAFSTAPPSKFDPGGKAISQWEATRQKLRAQAETFEEQVAKLTEFLPARKPIHPPTREEVTRRVLSVLAENGHHFRELSANERLTIDVVIRQRDTARCAKCHEAGASLLAGQPSAFTLSLHNLGSELQAGDLLVNLSSVQSGRSADENAGDLHMRQKSYEQAIKAYQRALDAPFGIARMPEAEAKRERVRHQQTRALHQKLAQAYVAGGWYKEAERMLKSLSEDAAAQDSGFLPQKAGGVALGPAKAVPSQSQAAKLPAHLIISATKSQLDAVAEGKMARDEFAKAAHIEYFDPLAAAAEANDEKRKPGEEKNAKPR